MNPNLSALQRAARNLFAAQTGINDEATIELAFLNPALVDLAEGMAAAMLTGPFGSIITAELDTTDATEAHGCDGLSGYVEGLSDVHDRLGSYRLEGGSTAVHQGFNIALDAVRRDIEDRIAEVSQPELPLEPATNDDAGTSEIEAFFSNLFGMPVQVIDLREQASR
jgi:hypothetical protein